MLEAEAAWLAEVLLALPASAFPLLNLGSSTTHFRTEEQPFIDRLIFEPLRKTHREVLHADAKSGDGVDLTFDFADATQRERLLATYSPRSILCTNMLEHLAIPPSDAARFISDLVVPGGWVVVTVPQRFGYHADPIDNGFRPTPQLLASLFGECEILRTDTVEGPVLAVHHGSRRGWARYAARAVTPFYRPRQWSGIFAHSWRRAQVACIVGRKR